MKRILLTIAVIVGAGLAEGQACHTGVVHASGVPSAPKQAEGLHHTIPDIHVITQDGKAVNFYSDLVKGKVVAVNFVFTSCTTVCPPLGAIFGKLQGQSADAQLISVSIDPEVDTPARLKAWSQKFGAKPGWTLVTGKKDDITRLLKAMNAYSPDYVNHQPVTLLGNDATGTWRRSYGFTSATKLAAMLEELR